jgi:hypothetical protein
VSLLATSSRDIIAPMKTSILAVLCLVTILLAAADLWKRTTLVHAQSSLIYVTRVPITGDYGMQDLRSHGSTIVGFSCVQEGTGGNACFVASR